SRNYVKLTGLQVFAPNDQVLDPTLQDSLVVPLEVIVDYRYDHDGFSRLLSQSDGTLHYDKFNRLRVQNGALSHLHNITEVSEHIRNYTDRVSVHIPRFSVSAKSNEFAAI
ncbi:uncharacterized protein EI90DRAFT_2847225, partial [Cantharellus anzutake]|uniref:uncharacterized protein n=1 Tax=Cantharellus anzutake TaxID=1750568 RepID=UPI00190624D2